MVELDGLHVGERELHELSGIAWSEDEQLLYMVSDRGYLAWLQPEFAHNRLTGARLTALFPLRGEQDRPLRDDATDSEGLELLHGNDGLPGNSLLWISFERQPRICRYSPTGQWRGCESPPDTLAEISRYASPNKALEALALHPVHGLLTGAERPRMGEAQDRITLYSDQGAHWLLVPRDTRHGALVGLSVLPGGDLLLLERSSWSILHGFQIAVHRVDLASPEGRERASPEASTPTRAAPTPVRELSSQVLLTLGEEGAPHAENFEGIAVRDANHFFLVSDDNGLPFQKSLLYYFWIPPQPDPTSGSH